MTARSRRRLHRRSWTCKPLRNPPTISTAAEDSACRVCLHLCNPCFSSLQSGQSLGFLQPQDYTSVGTSSKAGGESPSKGHTSEWERQPARTMLLESEPRQIDW